MANAPVIAMDTETTGLSLNDDIWEFGAIRRNPDGSEEELHLFIDHDFEKCHRLPRDFRLDHFKRYDEEVAVSPGVAAARIWEFTRQHVGEERPHIVGAVPDFDTQRVAKLLREFRLEPGWHYHIICAEVLAIGYLAGQPRRVITGLPPATVQDFQPARLMAIPDEPMEIRTFGPPWHSDDLSRALGIEITEEDRHTAMGDARWALRVYDRVMGA